MRSRIVLLRLCTVVSLFALSATGCTVRSSDPLPGEGEDEGRIVVYRDSWGVPHIYAPTLADGLYAMGYAQAEDRPQQLLQNLLIAIGEFASVAGSAAVPSDLRSVMFDHFGAGQRALDSLDEELRSEVQAFADGINAFYRDHPEDLPAWWGDRSVDVPMILAFGRLFLYNWSIDEAYGDLRRGGVAPGWDPPQRGSNQFAVAPSRTAEGAAILAIDPHLAWDGPSRFWEVRMHAGPVQGSGVTLAGSPYIGLGHNQHVAWAMTTGGPDTADVYRLNLRERAGELEYRYEGEWRSLERRSVTLRVRGESGVEEQEHTLWFSHHGPVIARDGEHGYAAKIAYGDLVTLEAWRRFNLAEDYAGVEAGMAGSTLFPQNVMVADTSGNIYYQRTGRVPRRDPGYDWASPVDGSTVATEWQGIHPASDHLQVLNPEQGWMQNCNIPPDAMMPNSPFAESDVPAYLYAGPGHGPARGGWTNQRGARAVQLLSADQEVTVDEAIRYINDIRPYGVERWIEALSIAAAQSQEEASPDLAWAFETLRSWDFQLAPESQGALLFAAWREELMQPATRELHAQVASVIDHWYSIISGEPEPPLQLDEIQRSTLLSAFERALDNVAEDYGDLRTASYGDRFRVGRDQDSWGVAGGGGNLGLTTLRNVGFAPERTQDSTRRGNRGQTSTQVVLLTEPPQSWIVIPWGQSDRPDSPHFDDQAERLFANNVLKDSWWLPAELAPNIESRTVLER